MKITAPHMGHLHFMLDDLFERLDVEYVKPPLTTTKTLQIGAKVSPEFACLPLKINMGNFIEGLEAGADSIVMAGGHGPCRFGYYGIVEERILRDLGYDFKFFMLEPFNDGAYKFYKTFEALSPGLGIRQLWGILKLSFSKGRAFDRIHRRALQIRPYEITRGDTSRALREAESLLIASRTAAEIEEAAREARAVLEAVEQDLTRDVIKVGIVGEFFLLLEPFSNFGLEEVLGNMGVYIERSVWVTDWIAPQKKNIIFGWPKKYVDARAEPYLNHNVGGEGRETVGSFVIFAEQGFDGVIQLLPFGCMPENIATSILPKAQQKHDVPVLTLAFDEQTGRAGVVTRVEAFFDLLKARRGGGGRIFTQAGNDTSRGAKWKAQKQAISA